jgi:hypothetical protein
VRPFRSAACASSKVAPELTTAAAAVAASAALAAETNCASAWSPAAAPAERCTHGTIDAAAANSADASTNLFFMIRSLVLHRL